MSVVICPDASLARVARTSYRRSTRKATQWASHRYLQELEPVEPTRWELLLSRLGISEANVFQANITEVQMKAVRIFVAHNWNRHYIPEQLLDDYHRMRLEQWPHERTK